MRRHMAYVQHKRRKNIIYTCALIALVAYAIPRIPEIHHGMGGTFSVLWILFAGLAIAANLYFVVGADKERSKMLELQNETMVQPSDVKVEHRRAL